MKQMSLVFALALFVGNAAAEPVRSWGTVDSFGLIRWERLSDNPSIGPLVTALSKSNPTLSDLRTADWVISRSPNDLASRALRAELRLRVDPSAKSLPAPIMERLGKLPKPDRFEESYLYYHRRREENPERYGITTDWDKVNPPLTTFGQHDLVALEVSEGLDELVWTENLLFVDWFQRRGNPYGRKLLTTLRKDRPGFWEMEALRVPLLRCGGYTMTGTHPGVAADKLKQFPQALVLVQRLRREHPECRVLDQMAGVAALDLKKNDLARIYFKAYLTKPDSGIQGERRSRDVRELLAKLK